MIHGTHSEWELYHIAVSIRTYSQVCTEIRKFLIIRDMRQQQIETAVINGELIPQVKCGTIVNIVDTHKLYACSLYIKVFALVFHNVHTDFFKTVDILSVGVVFTCNAVHGKACGN